MRRFVPLFAMTLLLVACGSTSPAPAPAPAPPPPPPPPPQEQLEEAAPTPVPEFADCPPSSSCATTGACPTEPATARLVEIVVDKDGNANPYCVKIRKGNSVIVWTATDDVEKLEVRFKPGQLPPSQKDPVCEDAECVLGKAKQWASNDEIGYSICVTRKDGTKAYCDPKLIILR